MHMLQALSPACGVQMSPPLALLDMAVLLAVTADASPTEEEDVAPPMPVPVEATVEVTPVVEVVDEAEAVVEVVPEPVVDVEVGEPVVVVGPVPSPPVPLLELELPQATSAPEAASRPRDKTPKNEAEPKRDMVVPFPSPLENEHYALLEGTVGVVSFVR